MGKTVNERNFAAIEQALNTVHKENMELREKIQIIERNMVMLQQQIAIQRQIPTLAMSGAIGSTVGES